MTLFKLTTADENGLQPTKWAKESSPGQSRGLDPCDALGQRIGNDSPRVGVGSPPTPTRGENFGKYGLSTQGMADGGAHRHLACRLLSFVRYALGYVPMAFQAIFIRVSQLVPPAVALFLILVASVALAVQIRSERPVSAKTESSANTSKESRFPVQFTDITKQAGIRFTHNNGAFGKKFLPETMGAGCAFLDYNNDGWQDILLINGMDWRGHRRGPSYPALYRNNKNGTFTDVTREAGLAVEMYGMGVAVGDYDNDGFEDIYISCLGPGHLFRNLGNGKFVDVTQKAKISNSDFASSCAWLDYDRDGRLDLFICNYVQWSMETDIFCTLDGISKSYCTPESYKGASSRLYHNLGDGTFEDVTQKAGLLDPTSKSLGVAVLDCNNDGWPDLLIANDTQPNKLYVNNKNGTFSERGVTAGIAYSEDGTVRGAMGVDSGDYDGSGFASLVIGNFSNEMLNLYHNEGNGLFLDEAPTSTVGQASLLTLAFGCFFFDVDLDGKMDIFVADGHVETDINRVQKRVIYA